MVYEIWEAKKGIVNGQYVPILLINESSFSVWWFYHHSQAYILVWFWPHFLHSLRIISLEPNRKCIQEMKSRSPGRTVSEWIETEEKKKKNEISYRCPLPILNFDCAQKIEWRNERQNWKADRNEWKFKGTKKRKNRSTFRRNNLILNRIEFKITIAQRMELSFFSSSFTSFNTFPIPQRMKEFLLKCWIENWRIYLFLSDLFLNLSFNRFVRVVTHRIAWQVPKYSSLRTRAMFDRI